MALTGSLDSAHRRAEIVELARRAQGASIDELARRFGISTMTVRRDLAALEEEGLIRRVRGGAIAQPAPRRFGDRMTQHAAAKRAIAKKSLEFVPDRGVIALDASTTIGTLAGLIGGRQDLSVCTNSPQTFLTLSAFDGVHPLLTGGMTEPITGSLVGPLATQGARTLRTGVLFVSAAALDPIDGSSEVSLAEAEIKQVMAERAERVVLCVDTSKLGGREVARALALQHVSVLITELDPADARLDPYRDIEEIR